FFCLNNFSLMTLHVNILINTCFYFPGPKIIKVKEGDDVTLPCSLWNKDIRSTQFIWQKMSQNDESQMEVFLYDKGELPDQSEQFKGRVSHCPSGLKHGDASITIRNITRADGGVYRCSIPLIRKHKKFHIKLVVGEPRLLVGDPKLIKVEEGRDVTLPCSLWTKEDLRSTQFIWENTDSGQEVFLYDKGDLYSDERPGQSEKFKGRVSHFPDELEQGNASIIIRNTTRADSGEYRFKVLILCFFPFLYCVIYLFVHVIGLQSEKAQSPPQRDCNRKHCSQTAPNSSIVVQPLLQGRTCVTL
uniref:Ig-like domain-containing protein n=1 Tax=Sander lucioperca TaxID=283035 RepID=A0A8D0A6X8_SANLU